MLKNSRIVALGLTFSLIFLPLASQAATVHTANDWCGTHETLGEIATAQHKMLERRALREAQSFGKSGRFLVGAQSAPQVSQEGDVVIMVDDGSLIREPNPSDASDSGYFIRKKKKKLKLTQKPGGVASNLGEKIQIGDDDTVEFDFEKGFTFKFFGKKYSSVYVNSDGNLTFGEGDSASTSRDLGRVLNGPARVMPYFVDLDPSSAGDVYINQLSKKKLQITWMDVPEFGSFTPNTFQVTLFKKGHVQIKFAEMNAPTGIVGVSPGGGASVELLDFSEDAPTSVGEQALAEVFGTEQIVDESAIAGVFYDHYPDDVEQIVVYYDFILPLLGGNAVAYHFTTKNDVKGIGYKNFRSREVFDNSSAMGSDGVLEGFANMGYVHKYDDDLNELRDTLTHLGVFIHELGHQWLSRLFYRQGGNTRTELQENGGHWSFNTHTGASFMQGNDIRDNGDGSFTTLETDANFSDADLYVLGLIPPEEVDPFFYVANSGQSPGQLPQFNFNMFGSRVDVSIDDVISEEGPREPSHEDSPKEFRTAMILLVPAGQTPLQASIDKVQDFADQGASEWRSQTRRLQTIDFTLTPN